MKHTTLLCSALILLASTAPARAQGNATAPATPSAINYQGVLSNPDGSPVNGVRSMRVKIYDAPTGGRIVYSEDIGNVTVQNGAYSFAFGNAGTGVASALTGNDHLALEVNGAEGAPRTRLLAVPYALKSKESADAQYTFQTLVALGVLPIFEDNVQVLSLRFSNWNPYPNALAFDRNGVLWGSDGNVFRAMPDGTAFYLSVNGNFTEPNNTIFSDRVGANDLVFDSLGNLFFVDGPQIRKFSIGGNFSVFAGNGIRGHADGPGTTAMFTYLNGLALDRDRNIYVTDSARVRKITPDGFVSTIAGNGTFGFADGPGISAMFSYPRGIAVDGSGNVFVADTGNQRIRKITPSGLVSTLAGNGVASFADGPAATAMFNEPQDLATDANGNVYVADSGNARLRKVTERGDVTTLAGSKTTQIYGNNGEDGPGPFAIFLRPTAITLDANGDFYVGDPSSQSHRIRKITVSD
jgi:sugar lactone lactonase YvrE